MICNNGDDVCISVPTISNFNFNINDEKVSGSVGFPFAMAYPGLIPPINNINYNYNHKSASSHPRPGGRAMQMPPPVNNYNYNYKNGNEISSTTHTTTGSAAGTHGQTLAPVHNVNYNVKNEHEIASGPIGAGPVVGNAQSVSTTNIGAICPHGNCQGAVGVAPTVGTGSVVGNTLNDNGRPGSTIGITGPTVGIVGPTVGIPGPEVGIVGPTVGAFGRLPCGGTVPCQSGSIRMGANNKTTNATNNQRSLGTTLLYPSRGVTNLTSRTMPKGSNNVNVNSNINHSVNSQITPEPAQPGANRQHDNPTIVPVQPTVDAGNEVAPPQMESNINVNNNTNFNIGSKVKFLDTRKKATTSLNDTNQVGTSTNMSEEELMEFYL